MNLAIAGVEIFGTLTTKSQMRDELVVRRRAIDGIYKGQKGQVFLFFSVQDRRSSGAARKLLAHIAGPFSLFLKRFSINR